MSSNTVDVYLYSNQEGKFRPPKNKEKELNNGTVKLKVKDKQSISEYKTRRKCVNKTQITYDRSHYKIKDITIK